MPPNMPPPGGMGGMPPPNAYPGMDVAPGMGAPGMGAPGMGTPGMGSPGMPAYSPQAPMDGTNPGYTPDLSQQPQQPPAGGAPEESFEERLARLKNM